MLDYYMDLSNQQSSQSNTSEAWSERGDYWLKKINPIPQYKAKKRRIIHKPLVLSGHGIRLNIHCDTLLIKCGFTHYPQKREEYRFFPQDRQLPSRIVILDGDGSISLDALEWLSNQGVSLVQIDWKGDVSSVGGVAYSADFNLVKKQLEFKNNKKGINYSKFLISEKIKNACETVQCISDNSENSQLILNKMREQLKILRKTNITNVTELLTIEGIAAAAYFRYWYYIPLKWKGINRKPLPQEWLSIGTRIGKNKSNQFASHPVNAILNYAYGVLENQVRSHILSIGADPTIGYMHSIGIKRGSFVFDLMEPVRPVMDFKIFNFVINHTFSPDDFILNKNGICRLHPQFARFIVKQIQEIPEIKQITSFNLRKLFN